MNKAEFDALFENNHSQLDEEISPVVAYERIGEKFRLYTISSAAVRSLLKVGVRFSYDQNVQCFVANTKNLPKSKEVIICEHRVVVPTSSNRKKLEEKYKKYKKAAAVIEKMQKEMDKLEEQIISDLKNIGIKLKPGSPDSQLLVMSEKTRLHYQQSMFKSYDIDAVKDAKIRYGIPELHQCVETKVTEKLNRGLLEEALTKMEPRDVASIVQFDPTFSFVETKLKNPECIVCGGKVLSTNLCKRCGTTRKERI